MANPQFTDKNGNFNYIWVELPVVPSDRPDVDDPVNVDRAILELKHANIIVQTKLLTSRGRWSVRFIAISEAMVLALQFFYGKNFIRYYPDADNVTFKEVFLAGAFRPIWQPGGRYDLTLDLRQYSP